MDRRQAIKVLGSLTVAGAVHQALAGVGAIGRAVGIARSGSASWQLPAGHYVTSAIPLQIIGPRSGATGSNPYGKWYTGMSMALPVLVMGGAFPFHFALSGTYPTGTTIGADLDWAQWNSTSPMGGTNADYGVITCSSPAAGTYSPTVTVTDQAGTQVSVTWTLTITTTGFVFIDSVNGSASGPNGGTGTGTISAPFKTLNDVYAGATGGVSHATIADATYQGDFIILRAGTYATNACYLNATGLVAWQTNKPMAIIGYPGETAALDFTGAQLDEAGGTTQGFWIHSVGFNNIGAGSNYQGIRWDSGLTDQLLYNCQIGTMTGPSSSVNPAWLMSDSAAPNITQYMAVSRCAFAGVSTNAVELFELYDSENILVEYNSVSNNISGGAGFYFKQGNRLFQVRGNYGSTGNGSVLCRYDNMDATITQGTDADISWNNYQTTSQALAFGTFGNNWGSVSLGRNTWQAEWCEIAATTGTGSGTITVTGDVNIGNGTYTNNWYESSFSGTLTLGTDYLTGTSATAIVDANGDLQGTYRTNYLGLSGHEIA